MEGEAGWPDNDKLKRKHGHGEKDEDTEYRIRNTVVSCHDFTMATAEDGTVMVDELMMYISYRVNMSYHIIRYT